MSKGYFKQHRIDLLSQVSFADVEKVVGNVPAPMYDAHTLRAAEHFNVAPHEVTPEQRRIGKNLNHGMRYA